MQVMCAKKGGRYTREEGRIKRKKKKEKKHHTAMACENFVCNLYLMRHRLKMCLVGMQVHT